MHAINKLVMLYNQLETDDFYKNAIYQVLKNLEAVPLLSTYDLAEKCFVSPATILRLSKKLGYETYSEFKLSVGMDLKEVRDNLLFSYEETQWDRQFLGQGIDSVIKTLEQIREDIPEALIVEAADALYHAEHIAFYTTAGSSHMRNLQMRLIISGKDVHIAKTLQEQKQFVAGLQPGTVVFFTEMKFALKREYEEMCAHIKACNGKIIFITDTPTIPFMDSVDIFIGFKGSTFRRDGLGIETILASIAVAYSNHHLIKN